MADSFSEIAFAVTIPRKWEEMSDDQRMATYEILGSGLDSQEAKVAILLRFADIHPLPAGTTKDGIWARLGNRRLASGFLSYVTIAAAATTLDYIEQPPTVPWLPCKLNGRHRRVEPDLTGFAFGDWLILENNYQEFISTKEKRALRDILESLYCRRFKSITESTAILTLHWMASVKQLFSKEFPDLFKSADSSVDVNSQYLSMRRNMNSQIRALTGGDITRERAVLELDVWRALTELDAKAEEYRQLNQKH